MNVMSNFISLEAFRHYARLYYSSACVAYALEQQNERHVTGVMSWL